MKNHLKTHKAQHIQVHGDQCLPHPIQWYLMVVVFTKPLLTVLTLVYAVCYDRLKTGAHLHVRTPERGGSARYELG